jgi:hypothetical protein
MYLEIVLFASESRNIAVELADIRMQQTYLDFVDQLILDSLNLLPQ